MQSKGRGGMGCVMIGEQWGVGQIWEDDSGRWCVVLSRDVCNMFRIIKRKNMLMKTNMTGDIHAMRFNVKTSITKVRGTVAKKTHVEKTENPIFYYYMDTKKKNRDIQKYAKNDNQETVETNNQKEIDLKEQE